MKFGAFFVPARVNQQKERGNKEKKKRKKGDRKTAPPYIFSSPKVEEKKFRSKLACVRVCAKRRIYLRSYVSGLL